MKTLWEKLSEENKTNLKNIKHEYPAIVKKLITVLKQKVNWTDLTIIETMHLFIALEIKEFIFITPLENLFYGN